MYYNGPRSFGFTKANNHGILMFLWLYTQAGEADKGRNQTHTKSLVCHFEKRVYVSVANTQCSGDSATHSIMFSKQAHYEKKSLLLRSIYNRFHPGPQSSPILIFMGDYAITLISTAAVPRMILFTCGEGLAGRSLLGGAYGSANGVLRITSKRISQTSSIRTGTLGFACW